jgi:hypothetical protein
MNAFSIAGAWRLGLDFFTRHWLAMTLLLLGLGLALPLALQYAVAGGPIETVNLARVVPDPYGNSWLVDRPAIIALLLAGYIAQAMSYFAAWRLGFGAPIGRALLYGLLAGLLAIFIGGVARTIGQYGSELIISSDTVLLAVIVFLLPLLVPFAFFFMTQTIMVSGVVMLVLAFQMIAGAATGSLEDAATMVGGDGAIAVLLLVLSGFMFWLAGRLSCAAPWMAANGSLNVWAGFRESWRMTEDEQTAIARYLLLVGVVMALAVIGLAFVLGEGMRAIPRGGVGYTFDLATLLPRVGLAIPFAILSVMIPAGIYRQIKGEETQLSAEIFE